MRVLWVLSHPDMGPGLKPATHSPGKPRSMMILLTDRSENEIWLRNLLLEACSVGNHNVWNRIEQGIWCQSSQNLCDSLSLDTDTTVQGFP